MTLVTCLILTCCDVHWLTKGASIRSDGGFQALVAQRIRASDYGSEGREFESLQARYQTAQKAVFFWLLLIPRDLFPTIHTLISETHVRTLRSPD